MSATTLPSEPRLSPVEAYAAQVLPPERSRDVYSALPAHIKPERFYRNLVNALMQNPKLMKCDPRLVYREVSKAAGLGLLIDPQLGEAYIIVGWNGRERREEPQLRVGYRGLIKLARQSGDIAQIYAHEVCANDEHDIVLGDQKKLVHKPLVFGDRGDVLGYYAVAKFSDGTTDFELMTLDQIYEIRDRSDGWKAFKSGNVKATPWSTDEGEMAKKTVIRRLVKRLPQSPELADVIGNEDEAEHGELTGVPRYGRQVSAGVTFQPVANPLADVIEYHPEAKSETVEEPASAPPPSEPAPAGDAPQGAPPAASAQETAPDDAALATARMRGADAAKKGKLRTQSIPTAYREVPALSGAYLDAFDTAKAEMAGADEEG